MKKAIVFIVVLMIQYFVSSCIYMCGIKHSVFLYNRTNDTILVAQSSYDNVDSIDCFLEPANFMKGKGGVDSCLISLTGKVEDYSQEYPIAPDSACHTILESLFYDSDTCFLFLVKFNDVRKYSWKEICSKGLYHKYMVVRDKDGNFDRNIRYKDE